MKSWKKTRRMRKKLRKRIGRKTRRPRKVRVKNLPIGQKKRRKRKIIRKKKRSDGKPKSIKKEKK